MTTFAFAISPQEVKDWLEWAGSRLVALPSGHVKPASFRVIWPDYASDPWALWDTHGELSVRALAPSRLEIPLMDAILTLPARCDHVQTRRVICARLLVHPVRGYNLKNWARVAREVESDPLSCRRMFTSGIREIASKMTPIEVLDLKGRFEAAAQV